MSYNPTRHLQEALALTVIQCRQNLDISQEKLAEKTGFSRVYISLLERCKRKPGLDSVFRLCQGLEITPIEFIKILTANQSNLIAKHQAYDFDIKGHKKAADSKQITYFKP
ncbi:MAG: helix-turn-helix transcriptional regulator [Fibrobacter sp.]|nr:helix-turn-helix transcriptional regulator [Fibrobacter sp.]